MAMRVLLLFTALCVVSAHAQILKNVTSVTESVLLPPAGLPDPRGLWIAGVLATVFTHDPFFPCFVFSLTHYLSVYPMHAAATAPPLMQREFIVGMLNLFVLSTIAGLGLLWGLGSPIMFPTHMSDRVIAKPWKARFGAYAITYAICYAINNLLIATELYWTNIPYDGELPMATYSVLYGFAFVFTIVVFVVVQVFTILGYDSMFAMSYYGHAPQRGRNAILIVVYVWLLIFLLAPQALFDFGAAPDGTGFLTFAEGGFATVAIEAVVWVVAYFVLARFFAQDKHHFSGKHSGVSWLWFVVTVGIVQVGTGILYILIVPALTTFEHLYFFMTGLTILVVIVGIIVRWRRQVALDQGKEYARIGRRKKAKTSDSSRRNQLSLR